MMKLGRQQFGAVSHANLGFRSQIANGVLPVATDSIRLQYCGITKRNLANEKASECGSTIDQG